ncbi:MAG: hypothetical protein AMJ53_16980, partial [Gammaproteobacteria bacterium SG8_11]
MKKIIVILVISLALIFTSQACNWPVVEFSGEIVPMEDTDGSDSESTTPPETAPPIPPASEPTPTNTPVDTAVPTATTICDLAGFITDVTVPDGAEADPGQHFTKTWRLQNNGGCTWTSGYDVVFTSGDQMGAPA